MRQNYRYFTLNRSSSWLATAVVNVLARPLNRFMSAFLAKISGNWQGKAKDFQQ
jgi:predicted DCC family thiol-disulfide oxidoreductase YuxK